MAWRGVALRPIPFYVVIHAFSIIVSVSRARLHFSIGCVRVYSFIPNAVFVFVLQEQCVCVCSARLHDWVDFISETICTSMRSKRVGAVVPSAAEPARLLLPLLLLLPLPLPLLGSAGGSAGGNRDWSYRCCSSRKRNTRIGINSTNFWTCIMLDAFRAAKAVS